MTPAPPHPPSGRAPMLFEVSWEVCNKVGGIHTVLTTKAESVRRRFGDDYMAIGPWLLSEAQPEVPFDDEPGHEDFVEACRSQGTPIRVGRWRTPGRPRTILVEFSRLYEHKDDVLAKLWENFQVDSISGGWDYVEPVLFGHAVGLVVERYWEEYLAPLRRRAIVHAHEWMTASALLHLLRKAPSLGTVFTTHATMLGRAMSSVGHSPADGLGDRSPEELAHRHHVVAKHSIEGVCARQADVFTTVSEITADEAEMLHGRRPDPLLPNGIDLGVIDELAGAAPRDEVRAKLLDIAHRFLAEDVSDAMMLAISGRYEFHNKGIDVLLEALARLERREGRRVLLWVLVPAGNSGVRSELRERMDQDPTTFSEPVGLSTHNLFDEDEDPVHRHCRMLALDNAKGSRVKVIQVPSYLEEGDGFLDLPYEAVLRAMDLTCFPSYYEPWGYTPQESLAVGVPTVTSDYAGFGRWMLREGFGPPDGVTVLRRVRVPHEEIVESLAAILEERLRGQGLAPAERCRATAARTSWDDLFSNYEDAYSRALEAVEHRAKEGVPLTLKPRRPVEVRPTRPRTPRLVPFQVAATVPDALRGLERLARNYWWTWDPEAVSLFEEIAPEAFAAARRNAFAFLRTAYPEDLEARANDGKYVARVQRVLQRFDDYLAVGPATYDLDPLPEALSPEHPVAYFCAEYGIHESLPIYSGGLGILAGDHLKSASDLNLPLVAVGLFYRGGYFEQSLTPDGIQLDADSPNDPRRLPLECVRNPDGSPLEVVIRLPGTQLALRAWRARVGRVSLYLLDADTPSNGPDERAVTKRLYGGDAETRILQEIALGRGGVRLLRRLGLRPAVCHMNEGHAAFSTLERVARLVREEGLTFDAAREYVRATTVFTTHTPVPAGHDRFSEDLMRRYFSDAEEWVGLPWNRFYGLGRAGEDESFNMTYLALSFSSYVNGVSRLHARVSRELLRPFWPGLLKEEIPIDSITNGVHLPTWTNPEVSSLLGVHDRPVRGEDFARRAREVDGTALWRARQEAKRALVEHARKSIERRFAARNDNPTLLARIFEGLDEHAMFLAFARRFAPYKRAHLLFEDLDRLRALLHHPERPLRVLVAGKAHPRDEAGKEVLRRVVELSRRDDLAGHVVFLEGYDVELARLLVRGADVWLNTPTRLQEASGTSGMKAAANATLNVSIADGWWPEAMNGANGWTIGGPRLYDDQKLQDQFDAAALYRLLEEEVLPRYFDRDEDGVPRAWVETMIECLATIPPPFQTDRMVTEYFDKAYAPAARRYFEAHRDRKARIRQRARDAHRLARDFDHVRIVEAQIAELDNVSVGDRISAKMVVDLGPLRPEDVSVELVLGHAGDDGELRNMVVVPLEPRSVDEARGAHVFEGSHRIERSGSYAHGLRVRAKAFVDPSGSHPGLVVWA